MSVERNHRMQMLLADSPIARELAVLLLERISEELREFANDPYFVVENLCDRAETYEAAAKRLKHLKER